MEVPTGVRSRYRVKSEGTKHWLIIDDASKDDTGTYSLMATGGTSQAHVQVDRMIILFFRASKASLFHPFLSCSLNVVFLPVTCDWTIQ